VPTAGRAGPGGHQRPSSGRPTHRPAGAGERGGGCVSGHVVASLMFRFPKRTVDQECFGKQNMEGGDRVGQILPLEPPYAPEVGAQLESMMPAGVAPIGLFLMFARNIPMATAMSGWGSYELSKRLSLSMR
jgi:hypothetical protein